MDRTVNYFVRPKLNIYVKVDVPLVKATWFINGKPIEF